MARFVFDDLASGDRSVSSRQRAEAGRWENPNGDDPIPAEEDETVAMRLLRMLPLGVDAHQGRPPRPFPDPSQENNFLVGHKVALNSMAFSTDGKIAATAGGFDALVHDLEKRESIFKFNRHRQYTTAIAIHPDGQLIATGDYQDSSTKKSKVLVWDRETGKILKTFRGLDGSVKELQFSPDGERLYGCTCVENNLQRGEVLIWNLETGDQIVKTDSNRGPLDLDVSDDGKLIAVAARGNGEIFILDADTGEEIKRLGSGLYNSIEFSDDGQRLAFNNNWAIGVFNVESGETDWEKTEHTGQVTGVAFFPGGKRIASVSVDHSTKIWDATNGNVLLDLKGDEFYLHHVKISPDGRHQASFGEAPFVTLRSLSADFVPVGGIVDTSSWSVIFEEDFENKNFGERWGSFYGEQEIKNGALHGELGSVEGQPNFFASTIIPKIGLPSIVEVSYDA